MTEKIRKWLDGRKKGLKLSTLTIFNLVQFVLKSVPIYYLSFRAPVSVANRIEKMMRDFLWDGIGERRKDHLISWDVLSLPKNLFIYFYYYCYLYIYFLWVGEVLTLGHIVEKNNALFAKWSSLDVRHIIMGQSHKGQWVG